MDFERCSLRRSYRFPQVASEKQWLVCTIGIFASLRDWCSPFLGGNLGEGGCYSHDASSDLTENKRASMSANQPIAR